MAKKFARYSRLMVIANVSGCVPSLKRNRGHTRYRARSKKTIIPSIQLDETYYQTLFHTKKVQVED